MRLIQKLSGLFFAGCLSFSANAQDFNTQVTINTPKIQSVDPKIFKNLETAIEEFMNTRNWVEDNFEPEELIELNIVITIDKELSQTDFEGQMTIQASRPVYKSGYNSILFQNLDKNFKFTYGEYERLDFSENTFTSNLTSTLAFYAYVILGMDYDSFSEMGGEEHLQKAQDILNSVPRTAGVGWTADGGGIVNRSRYWVIENLLSPRMQDMRRAMYQYYMLGLDRIAQEDQTEKGLASILSALETIDAANQSNPNSMLVQLFSDAKKDEIINLFQVADFNTKRKVYGIMVKLDGTRANDYRVLLK
ncbi:MAG: Unknown protein [uncultured Aureispira sp.]|uniref:DUF4835 domain-containing protein n=1 Tax=uncultured Aureispira sp. TaxID=1331704 RepID=A0A6S6ULW0_9BACT|nr:MAG: Unknown protein [uncultured Aureispira sp.]